MRSTSGDLIAPFLWRSFAIASTTSPHACKRKMSELCVAMISLPYEEMTYKFSMLHKIIACVAPVSLTTIRLERLLGKKNISVANIVDMDFCVDQ